jgi:uncharacterized protein YyaL (SSP411 family)
LLTAAVVWAVPALSWAAYPEGSKIPWLEYGQAAFDRAKGENRPVFLLFTADWCHWCHVYEDETIESPEIAAYISRHFVPIVVDADKRQDLARQTRARGLPFTVVFSPRGGQVLSFSGHVKREDFISVLEKARTAAGIFRGQDGEDAEGEGDASRPASPPGFADARARLLSGLAESYEPAHGGFGQKGRFGTLQKFPTSEAYRYLAETAANDPAWRNRLVRTLDGLAAGLFDPVAGGFYRYSTEPDWRAPHYEKMLNVNASLGAAYAVAGDSLREERYRKIARGTFDYVLSRLHEPAAGAFWGSQVADVAYYESPPDVRVRRPEPRIVRVEHANWSAEAVAALWIGAERLKEPRYGEAALRGAQRLRDHFLTADRGVLHFRDPRESSPRLDGQLADNAWTALAFLETHRRTGDPSFLDALRKIVRYALSDLYDGKAGAFIERRSREESAYRTGEREARITPPGENAIMAYVLAMLPGAGREERDAAVRIVSRFVGRDVEEFDDGVLLLRAFDALLEKESGSADASAHGAPKALPDSRPIR